MTSLLCRDGLYLRGKEERRRWIRSCLRSAHWVQGRLCKDAGSTLLPPSGQIKGRLAGDVVWLQRKERCPGGSRRSEILIISTAECFSFSNTIILYQKKQHDGTRKRLTFNASFSPTQTLGIQNVKCIDPNTLQFFFQSEKKTNQTHLSSWKKGLMRLAARFLMFKCVKALWWKKNSIRKHVNYVYTVTFRRCLLILLVMCGFLRFYSSAILLTGCCRHC